MIPARLAAILAAQPASVADALRDAADAGELRLALDPDGRLAALVAPHLVVVTERAALDRRPLALDPGGIPHPRERSAGAGTHGHGLAHAQGETK